MSQLLHDFDAWPILFLLILTRVSGLFCLAPCFPIRALPWRGRWILITGLAMLLTTAQVQQAAPIPNSAAALGLAVACEAAIGLILGFVVLLLFSSLQLAGQIVTQLSGLRMADVYDSNIDMQIPVFGRLLYLVATAAFVIAGGHRQVMAAMLDTFAAYPPGQVTLVAGDLQEILTNAIAHSMIIAVRLSAPLVTALLFSMITLGLVSRALPQWNTLTIGLGANSLALSATILFAMGSLGWTFHHEATGVLNRTAATWSSILPSRDASTGPSEATDHNNASAARNVFGPAKHSSRLAIVGNRGN